LGGIALSVFGKRLLFFLTGHPEPQVQNPKQKTEEPFAKLISVAVTDIIGRVAPAD
jgi:hypothetical protein